MDIINNTESDKKTTENPDIKTKIQRPMFFGRIRFQNK